MVRRDDNIPVVDGKEGVNWESKGWGGDSKPTKEGGKEKTVNGDPSHTHGTSNHRIQNLPSTLEGACGGEKETCPNEKGGNGGVDPRIDQRHKEPLSLTNLPWEGTQQDWGDGGRREKKVHHGGGGGGGEFDDLKSF